MMWLQIPVVRCGTSLAYVLAAVDAMKIVSLAPIMTNGALGRLARIVGVSTLIIVSTTPRPRAEGVGTLAYVMHGECPGEGATSGYWPHCPLGLGLMHPDGSGQLQLTEDGADAEPAWSPDGLQLAFSRSGDVYVMPAIGGTLLNLTNHPAADTSPAWSPDGGRIAFTSDRDGGLLQLYLMNVDGSNVVRLATALGYAGQPAWSPDGSTLAFDCVIDVGNGDICAVSADGSTFRRLTTDPAWDSAPAWSPDGATIAFVSLGQIAIMDADGSNGRRLYVQGDRPSWSPDGTQIVFHVIELPNLDEYPSPPIVLAVWMMNLQDGTVSRITEGFDPAWRPNGANLPPVPSFSVWCLAHVCSFDASYSVDPDGSINRYVWDFGDGTTGAGAVVSHTYPSGTPSIASLTVSDDNGATASRSRTVEPNARPFAYADVTCNGRTCSFDGSGSPDYDGTIVSYHWTFGDGTVGSGATVVHMYATPGIYPVTLTVTDNEGASAGPIARTALASTPPIASFTFTCTELACVFDASASTDPDGTVASYQWAFGDNARGSGPLVSHTYPVPGTFNVQLIVLDNLGLMDVQYTNVTVPYDTAHVGDLDGVGSLQQNLWNATVTITVHDSRHAVVASALVTGLWTDGTSATCTTNGDGQCAVIRSGIPRRTTSAGFSVTNVTRAAFVYKAADNHDPDGSSSGTTISISKP
jgi:PKD repeat protein